MKSLPPEYLPCFELENIDVCVRDYMKVERASTFQMLVYEAIWDLNFHRTFLCALHVVASIVWHKAPWYTAKPLGRFVKLEEYIIIDNL